MPEAAESLATASRVLIVPGYGLAVANAQHSIAELTKMLRKKDVHVRVRGAAACVAVAGSARSARPAAGLLLLLLLARVPCAHMARCAAASAASALILHKPSPTRVCRWSLASTRWRAACLARWGGQCDKRLIACLSHCCQHCRAPCVCECAVPCLS